jgi:sec-independent protein translocase protein TatB
MFDIGISEIMVIAVVALVVLGPEKLPKTARTLGHLFGRLQRYVGEVKADINRELAMEDLKKLQAEVNSAASDFQASMTSAAKDVEDNVRAVETSLNAAAAGDGSPIAQGPAAPVMERGAAPSPAPQAMPSESRAPEASRQPSLPGFERG